MGTAEMDVLRFAALWWLGVCFGSSIKVTWEGHLFVHHSLAHVNRELVRRLIVQPGIDLRVERTDRRGRFTIPELRIVPNLRGIIEAASMAGHGEAEEVHVQHQWPPRIKAPRTGRWVWIQPWELGSIPKYWAAIINEQVD